VVADHCPNWGPLHLAGKRRFRFELEAEAVCRPIGGPGAPRPAPTKRVLPAAELTALAADPVLATFSS
jgi:hypothetical protein